MISLTSPVSLSLFKTKFDILRLGKSSFLQRPLIRPESGVSRRNLSFLHSCYFIELDSKS